MEAENGGLVPQASKRAKSIEWQITFDQTQSLRTMFEVVGNILTRINVRITKTTDSNRPFLCIDSIDPQHVCMIKARLQCEKSMNLNEEKEFCVDANIINSCLKNTPNDYSIDITKMYGSDNISMRAYESLSNSHTLHYDIPTLVDDSERMNLTDLQYKYTIEIDLGLLRNIVKMSGSLRSEHMQISVLETEKEESSQISISAKGDATITHNFFSSIVHDSANDTCTIKAMTESSAPESELTSLRLKYKESYSVKFLNYFLKSMERTLITMKLSENKPLILHYPLGAEKSFICFVLAPHVEEDE